MWTNLPFVPPFYKETEFSAPDWQNAPDEFAIITAFATTGEKWTDEQNSVADRKLKYTLRVESNWLSRITGYSPTSGHREPGWAAAVDFERACDIGMHFKQDAIYFVRKGKLFVSYCDARRTHVSISKFTERLHITS